MKTTKILVLIFSALLLTVGCKKEEEKKTTASASSRDLFSLWKTSNNAITYDLRLGNLVASNFNAYVSYSTGDICTCVTNISGAQDFGGYSSTCSLTTNVTATDCSVWNTTDGGATYTNNGSSLGIKRSTSGSLFSWPN